MMQREIKFRAWSNSKKRMIWGPAVDQINSAWVYTMATASGYDDDIILMQYTGLKDKNGKEIYEGDIVSGYNGKPVCAVSFENGNFNWDGYPLSLDADSWEVTPTEKWAIVIGNIHENPEVLTS